jgi:hypothetical protein|tara:strand:- start:2706 stop:3719 length:1014 start_codon:yes stop_codon:yes gene_type:complete
MRAELFAKGKQASVSEALSLLRYGARGLNLPNKARADAPLAHLQLLARELPEGSLSRVCPHWSVKFNAAGGEAATVARLEEFCAGARALGVREALLVSGSGSRKLDSLRCLEKLNLPESDSVQLGVAFNPYLPERSDRMRERARLRLKIRTGRVSAVWLQIGSDLHLLREGLEFIRELESERNLRLRLYGSIFLPTEALLARMRRSPWHGVHLDDAYLRSVPSAKAITAATLETFAAFGVEILLESPVSSATQWGEALSLVASPAASDLPAPPLTLRTPRQTDSVPLVRVGVPFPTQTPISPICHTPLFAISQNVIPSGCLLSSGKATACASREEKR